MWRPARRSRGCEFALPDGAWRIARKRRQARRFDRLGVAFGRPARAGRCYCRLTFHDFGSRQDLHGVGGRERFFEAAFHLSLAPAASSAAAPAATPPATLRLAFLF